MQTPAAVGPGMCASNLGSYMAWGSKPWIITLPWRAGRTIEVFQRTSIQNMEVLHLRHPVIAKNQVNHVAGQYVGGGVCTSSRMLHTTLSPYSTRTCSPVHCSLLSFRPCCISSSVSFHLALTVPFLHLSHLSNAYSFIILTLEMIGYHTVCILLT